MTAVRRFARRCGGFDVALHTTVFKDTDIATTHLLDRNGAGPADTHTLLRRRHNRAYI